MASVTASVLAALERFRLARGCASWLLALALASSSVFAQTEAERSLEMRVKAAFLYRFTEFVSWSPAAFPRPDAPFVIAVFGREAMAQELRSITAGRTVGGRAIQVRRGTDAESMRAAHIAFLADSERARLRELIRAVPHNTLIVTESEGALAQGSVINFVIVDGRVRFEISLESAEKQGMQLSSRLLAVAHSVRSQ